MRIYVFVTFILAVIGSVAALLPFSSRLGGFESHLCSRDADSSHNCAFRVVVTNWQSLANIQIEIQLNLDCNQFCPPWLEFVSDTVDLRFVLWLEFAPQRKIVLDP